MTTRKFLMVATLFAVIVATLAGSAGASSHREAPLISRDPSADNTDLYAFVSPDAPTTVTIIANYIPLEEPAGGPNFNSFDDSVLYEIHVDNDGDAEPDITYQFRFKTTIGNPNTFLYNTGPITSLSDPAWNMSQTTTMPGAPRFDFMNQIVTGQHQSLGMVYGRIQAQAAMLSFNDIYRMLAAMALVLIPCFLWLKQMGKPGAPAAH